MYTLGPDQGTDASNRAKHTAHTHLPACPLYLQQSLLDTLLETHKAMQCDTRMGGAEGRPVQEGHHQKTRDSAACLPCSSCVELPVARPSLLWQ